MRAETRTGGQGHVLRLILAMQPLTAKKQSAAVQRVIQLFAETASGSASMPNAPNEPRCGTNLRRFRLTGRLRARPHPLDADWGALRDRAMNQPLALRRCDDGASEPSAARLTRQRHGSGRHQTRRCSAAPSAARRPDPSDRSCPTRFAPILWSAPDARKSRTAEAVVVCDHYRALSSQRLAIEPRSGADSQRATMRPQDHRSPFRSRSGPGPR